MPRHARLDAPGTLHHVILRGIEKRRIVDDSKDQLNFVSRMGEIVGGQIGDILYSPCQQIKKYLLNQQVKNLCLLRTNHSSVLFIEELVQTGKPLTHGELYT